MSCRWLHLRHQGGYVFVCVLIDIVALMHEKCLGIFMTYIKTLIKEGLRDNDYNNFIHSTKITSATYDCTTGHDHEDSILFYM